VQDGYGQAMRRATLGYLLHSPAFLAKMAPLALPPPPPPPVPPEIGVVAGCPPPEDFAAVLAAVQTAALGATPELLACQLGVHLESMWMRDVRQADLGLKPRARQDLRGCPDCRSRASGLHVCRGRRRSCWATSRRSGCLPTYTTSA
jgi:hypothetical protein